MSRACAPQVSLDPWPHHAQLGGAALHNVRNHVAGGHAGVVVNVGNAKAAGLVPAAEEGERNGNCTRRHACRLGTVLEPSSGTTPAGQRAFPPSLDLRPSTY